MIDILLKLNPWIIPIMWISFGVEIILMVLLLLRISKKNNEVMKSNWLNSFYNLFTVIISLFPMLGMLGTVLGLLNLDLTQENTDNLKQSFFFALETTAWGLVFSIFWKLVHSFLQDGVESAIEKSKESGNNKTNK